MTAAPAPTSGAGPASTSSRPCSPRPSPGAVAERSTLRRLLDDLPREALADLLVRRAEADPDLAGRIEAELAALPGRGPVDPAPIAAQARTLLGRQIKRDYRDDYEAHGPADALKQLVDKAVPFLEAGDGRNALKIPVAVAEPFIEQWLGYYVETDEDMYRLFTGLDRMMAEAALMSDLSADERGSLRETIGGWEDDLNDYAPEDGFFLVTAALRTLGTIRPCGRCSPARRERPYRRARRRIRSRSPGACGCSRPRRASTNTSTSPALPGTRPPSPGCAGAPRPDRRGRADASRRSGPGARPGLGDPLRRGEGEAPPDTKSGRSLPDFVSSARAAPERSRFPHREAINRKAYDRGPTPTSRPPPGSAARSRAARRRAGRRRGPSGSVT